MKRKLSKPLKALLLGILLYIAIPTIDDLVTIPFLSSILAIPIYILAFLYYGIAWILIEIVETML